MKSTPLQPLYQWLNAARDGNLALMKELWNVGNIPHINSGDKGNSTALHRAAHYDQYDVVAWLIKNGAEIDLPNKRGATAARLAAGQGHLSILKYLVQHGANLNILSRRNVDVFQWIAFECENLQSDKIPKFLETLQWLVDLGLDPTAERTFNWSDKGVTYLQTEYLSHILIASNAPIDIIKWAMKFVSFDVPDSYGYTALDLVVDEDYNKDQGWELMELLLSEHPVTVDLFIQTICFRPTWVELMMQRVEKEDQKNYSLEGLREAAIYNPTLLTFMMPLAEVDWHYIPKENHKTLVGLVMENHPQAIPHLFKPDYGQALFYTEKTPLLHLAIEKRPAFVKALIRQGADIHQRCEDGFTPLTKAAYCGQLVSFLELIDAGASLKDTVVNPGGRHDEATLLICAALNPNMEILIWLTEQGFRLDQQTKGDTELLALCRETKKDADVFDIPKRLDWLIRHGSSLRKRTIWGETAWHLVAKNNPQLLKWLFKQFDWTQYLDPHNEGGHSNLLDLLVEEKNVELWNELLEFGFKPKRHPFLIEFLQSQEDLKNSNLDLFKNQCSELFLNLKEMTAVLELCIQKENFESAFWIWTHLSTPTRKSIFNKNSNLVNLVRQNTFYYSRMDSEVETPPIFNEMYGVLLIEGLTHPFYCFSWFETMREHPLYLEFLDIMDWTHFCPGDCFQDGLFKNHEMRIKIYQDMEKKGFSLPTYDVKGTTWLMRAAERSLDEVVYVFNYQPLTVQCRDDKGDNALHWAARAEQNSVFQYLCERGLNPEQQNYDGLDAFSQCPKNIQEKMQNWYTSFKSQQHLQSKVPKAGFGRVCSQQRI